MRYCENPKLVSRCLKLIDTKDLTLNCVMEETGEEIKLSLKYLICELYHRNEDTYEYYEKILEYFKELKKITNKDITHEDYNDIMYLVIKDYLDIEINTESIIGMYKYNNLYSKLLEIINHDDLYFLIKTYLEDNGDLNKEICYSILNNLKYRSIFTSNKDRL